MQNKNQRPSAYTSIYWLIEDGKINPLDLFHFSELYWPTFIKKDKYVFLKEQFSDEEYDNLTKESENPEYWINLLTIDGFFSNLSDGKERSIALSKLLAEMWNAKLQKEFSELNFAIECLWNEEYGDCGLTFYQIDRNIAKQQISYYNEIVSPNIIENTNVQSSGGPRPGIPRIRKPRLDEYPT